MDAAKLTAQTIGLADTGTVVNLTDLDTVVATNKTVTLRANVSAVDPTKFVAGSGTVNLVAETKDQTVTVVQNDGAKLSATNSAFSKLVLTGAGNVTFDNADNSYTGSAATNDAKAVEVDASGLSGKLTFTGTIGAVDKVTLGAGSDTVNLIKGDGDTATFGEDADYDAAASSYNAIDIITGFTAGKDKLGVADIDGDAGITVLKVTIDTNLQESWVAHALREAHKADVDVAYFIVGGNTYVVQDFGAYDGTRQDSDIVVQLIGEVTLKDTDFSIVNLGVPPAGG